MKWTKLFAVVMIVVMVMVTNVFGFVSIPITRMRNAVHAYPPGTATGLTLQDAYDYLTSSDRDAVMGTVGVLNRRTLILTPGVYTSTSFVLDTSYVDIEGIGLVIITDTSGAVIDCGSIITRISNVTLDGSSIANCLTNDATAVCESVTVTDGTNIEILVDGLSGAMTYDQTNGQLELGAGAVLTQDQLLLTPVSAAVGTTEGTVYYDSDTDKLTYRNASSWVSLPGSASAGGNDTEMQYNNGGTLAGITNVIWDGTNFNVLDDQDVAFGTAPDWLLQYDEGVDDQLLWITANTAAGAITDPMYEILVGATPTADQQVFGVGKGTQASNTALLTLDEDGDLTLAGTFYQAAIAAAASGNVNLTVDAAGTGTITFGATSTGKAVFTRAVELDGNTTIGDASSDTITVTGTIISDVALDDGTTDSPSITLQDATNETFVIVKLDNGDTTATIPADTDFEIVTGNLAVGNGVPGTAAMDGEDFYVNGDSEFDGAVQFDGAITAASTVAASGGVTITGTTAINISADAAITAVNIGTGGAAKTVALGSSNSTSTTTLLSGSGGLLLNVDNNQPTNINTGTSTGTTTIGNAASDISIPGHIQGANALILDGATDDGFETTIAVTDPTADIIWTFPDGGADTLAFMGSTLATNYPDVANSVTGGTNQLIFEGASADTEETIITATDPTADIIWTLADGGAQTVSFVPSTLATNFVDIANSIWGGTNQLIFEGSDADTEETVITVEDATADNTFTFADDSGDVVFVAEAGSTTKDTSNAALPLTDAIVLGTSGAASAWSLPDGEEGQILTVQIVTDGGEATITPDTCAGCGWATAVLTDDIDGISFLYVDDTVGWIVLGTSSDGTNIVALTQ